MVDCVFLCLAFHLVTRPESLALGRVYFLPGTCACWGASGGQSHRRASQALVKPQKASWSSLSGSANSQGSLSEGASAIRGRCHLNRHCSLVLETSYSSGACLGPRVGGFVAGGVSHFCGGLELHRPRRLWTGRLPPLLSSSVNLLKAY